MNELVVLSQKNRAIMQGFLFEPVALVVVGSPTFQEWELVGESLAYEEKGIHWWLGDWLNYGEKTWQENAYQALEHTRFSLSTLKADHWVAARIEPVSRLTSLSWGHHQVVAALEPERRDYWLKRADEEGWSRNELRDMVGVTKVQAMGMSESPEWYTPKHIIKLAVAALGEIDLDPCSNSHKVPNVPAKTHYTKDDDGLSRPWFGKVYLNPPYGDVIPDWIEKLVQSYEGGEVEAAIALLPGRIDTQWFQPLYEYLICHVRGRLQFVGSDNSAPFPSVVVYLGTDEQRFVEVFAELGPILQRVG